MNKSFWSIKPDYLFICLLAVGGVIFGLHYTGSNSLIQKASREANQELAAVASVSNNLNLARVESKIFPAVSLEAKSFVVYDIKTKKVLAGENYNQALPLASLTKIMTALVSSERVDGGKIVVVARASATNSADNGLVDGERWRFRDLLNYTLISSSNKGAQSLAEVTSLNQTMDFVSLMNQKAKELNLNSLKFNNETGLDVGVGEAGAYGSALDVAKLISYAALEQGDLLSATQDRSLTLRSLDDQVHLVANTNPYVASWAGRTIASKTGFTNLAGGNLAVVSDLGLDRPIALVVLGSSFDGRFSDMHKLLNATLAYLADSN